MANAVASTLAPSSTATASPLYYFRYPIRSENGSDAAVQVSSKDTIDVSWTYDGAQHPPVLELECWFRNTTNSEPLDNQRSPDLRSNLTATLNSSDLAFPLPLEAYAAYSACQLLLHDPTEAYVTGDDVPSSVFLISDNSTSAGQTWSVDNKAPDVANPEFATKSGAAAKKSPTKGGVWTFAVGVGIAVAAVSVF